MKKNLLLITGSLMVALLLAEIVLRAIDYSYPALYRADDCCGASLLPGAEGWQRNEGKAYIKINSHGLRDREHDFSKPSRTLRIAVLGDSYAEAAQVPLNQAFWAILENNLGHCAKLAGRSVEVINFGVSGYGTAQELQTLRYKVWKYDPDVVLLAFLSGNDIVNNSRVLEKDKVWPFFVLNDGELVLDDSFIKDPAYLIQTSWKAKIRFFLAKYLRLYQLREELRDKLLTTNPAQLQTVKASTWEPGLNDQVYLPPTDKSWKDAWAVTEQLIKTISDEVQQHGADFLLVILSNGVQVNPDAEYRKHYEQTLAVNDLSYPDQRIMNFAAEHNIPALSLVPYLLSWAEQHNTCVHGFENNMPCSGHWNAHAHALAGKVIADKICLEKR